jgi:UDPglucose 6-dehydrogenase
MPACRAQNPTLRIQYCDSVQELAEGADALVLVTEWKEFRDLNLPDLARRMARPVLVDGRNLFEPEAARQAGFDYSGVGRCGRTRARTEVAAPVTT